MTFTQGASGETAPKLKTAALSANVGAFIDVALILKQGTVAAQTMKPTISIDLSLKS